MHGIKIDLDMQELSMFYAYSEQEAFAEISNVLKPFGFTIQLGNAYLLENENMASLFSAMEALKKISWFPPSVRGMQVFRVSDWSDLTAFVRSN